MASVKGEPGRGDVVDGPNYDQPLKLINEVFAANEQWAPITLPLAHPPASEHPILAPELPFLIQLPSHLPIGGDVPLRQSVRSAQLAADVGAQRMALDDDNGDDNGDDNEDGGDDDDVPVVEAKKKRAKGAASLRGKQRASSSAAAATPPPPAETPVLVGTNSISLRAPLEALSVAKLATDGLPIRQSHADALVRAAGEFDEDADDVLPGNQFNNKLIEHGISGRIGKLRTHASGRMTLSINGQVFLLQRGVYPSNYVQAACVQATADGPDKLLSGLQLHDTLIATPSTKWLLDAMERQRQMDNRH